MAKQAKAQAVPRRRSRQVVLSYWAATFYVLILLALVLLLWPARREHEPHVRAPALKDFEQALPSTAGLTKAPILPGNRVRVLQNGDGFFPPLFRDIAAAK